jgi:periplasmic protein CpxP/Spy
MMKRILVAAGLVAALVGGSVVAYAQGPGGPGRPGIQARGPRGGARVDLGLRGVQLTDAQRQQVRAIRESHQAEFRAVGQKLREARRAFAEAARATAVDEAAIRERSNAVAAAMADEAILRAKLRAQVHALLTPEQQQQLTEREAAMQKRLQERQQRRPPQR